MLSKVRKTEGFTLIELLIVVAIIGILAAIAIPQFSAYRAKGYAATLNSDAKNAFTAAQGMLADDPAKQFSNCSSLKGYQQSKIASCAIQSTTTSFRITIAPTGAAAGKVTDASINHAGTLTTSSPK